MVAGITFRKNDVLRSRKATDQILALKQELNNAHDKNAINIIGIIPSARCFLGYVTKEVSEQLIFWNAG